MITGIGLINNYGDVSNLNAPYDQLPIQGIGIDARSAATEPAEINSKISAKRNRINQIDKDLNDIENTLSRLRDDLKVATANGDTSSIASIDAQGERLSKDKEKLYNEKYNLEAEISNLQNDLNKYEYEKANQPKQPYVPQTNNVVQAEVQPASFDWTLLGLGVGVLAIGYAVMKKKREQR